MPITELTPVKKLKLDLSNYRTTKQADERHAVEAIIAIKPDWFWALMESLPRYRLPTHREHPRSKKRRCSPVPCSERGEPSNCSSEVDSRNHSL